MIDLKAKPFYLTDDQIQWVQNTLADMNEDRKAEQLFCPMAATVESEFLEQVLRKYEFGGVMLRPNPAVEVQRACNYLQKCARIPLLFSANFEDGGNGLLNEGTYMGRQMLIAATGDENQAYHLGKICGREGTAAGANWAYAPVLDIDYNPQNPITNVRTYGNDPDRIIRMGRAYIKGLTEEGMIATIKHFPGDGVDYRDQHLLTSVNNMSIEEWESSYGRIYRTMIDEGAMTCMIGHIAMPAMEEMFDNKPCSKVIPATVSKHIMTDYLRGELGFNGLISTDASPMVGMLASTKRCESVPDCIENGADMILFTKNLDEDVRYMKKGIHSGRLSRKRLDEAVTRILAVKAAMKLPEKRMTGTIYKNESDLAVVGCREHQLWARECADKGITLVKDTVGLLPMSAEKHKKLLFELIGDFASNDRVRERFIALLKNEGFDVTEYVPETMDDIMKDSAVEDFKSKYDLVLYVGNIENASNKTTSRINWHTMFGAGNNIPWFANEVPTVFVSVGNPYHLQDVPMIHTYINGYCHSECVIDAVVTKLMGRSEFKGHSPIDPYCGLWDAKL